MIWHEHSASEQSADDLPRNVLKFGALRRGVSWIYCPAPDLARDIVRSFGPRKRTSFLPNAIDGESFARPTPQERAQARESLGLSESDKVVLGFSWNWKVKGGELMQLAVAELSRREPALRAVQLTQDGEAAASSQALGLERVLKVVKPTDAVRGLYAASDVFVAASRAEGGTPLAVLEALSCRPSGRGQ